MHDTQRFTITEDHLKLVLRLNISWDGCEFGSPAVDCKRPYGNSDVYNDIAEILGLELPDRESDEDFTPFQYRLMDKFHQDLKTVLQIGVCLLKFEVGTYETPMYCNKWKLIEV